jgi:hypothetical protein
MCPVCIATAALFAAKATSAGGLTALIAKKLHRKANANKSSTRSILNQRSITKEETP